MTLMAAFQVLLFRYTGQEDLTVGSPIANRTHSDIEDLIGFFVNTLVIRGDLSGNPGFRELLHRVRRTALEAYSNQELPFEKLVEALQPDRDLGRTPLFQVLFVLQNAPRTAFQLSGIDITPVDVHNGTSKFDISMFVVKKPEGLICTVEYSTEIFDPSTIQRLLGHYRALLESIVKDADERIGELQMLPPDEQHLLLSQWNDTSRSFARDRCIHELFERQVERSPENTAVIFEGTSVTYREFNQRSNQLAHKLRALGVGPETLVGLCVERSLEMLVAILGVLKAGGGYLPLDPAYPKERRAFMLEDAQVPVLLTETGLLAEVPQHQGVTICLDADWPSIANEPVTNPEPLAKPGNVAYVIYTSGSTGKPKGVMVTHENVSRLFTSTDHWFGFGPQDTWTLFHSFAFDFSVWEIWGALLYGGRLVVVPLETARSPVQFHELLVQQQVTVLNQTPSAFRQLIVADQESCNWNRLALRYVVFGGEALEFKTLVPWIERHGDKPALINMYGITETTVHVTYYQIDTAGVGEDTVSLVGVPIPDVQVYVLDGQRQLAPIGVPGEMYVGGYGVARGYLRRPELTAERFLPNPFNPDPGARLYKTGDLARILPDGNIQYLGRIDHQVKIRGFRIELGEIENTLDSHPGVRQSVVIVREDAPGDKRLVAYVVPNPSHGGSDQGPPEMASNSLAAKLVPQLRLYVGGKLPEYMVPSAFVLLEAMPLTANGKVIPAGAAGTGDSRSGEHRRLPRAADADRRDGRCDFCRCAASGARGPRRQLLRVGWALPVGDAGGVAHPPEPARRPAGAGVFESPTVASLAQAVELKQRGEHGMAGAAHSCRYPATSACRFRSLSSGCGCSTRSIPTIRCTTFRGRSA